MALISDGNYVSSAQQNLLSLIRIPHADDIARGHARGIEGESCLAMLLHHPS